MDETIKQRENIYIFSTLTRRVCVCVCVCVRVQKVDVFCDVPDGATVGDSCRERERERDEEQ